MRAILTFHSIDEQHSVISFPARTFENLLVTLVDKNIPIVDLDTLIKPDTRTGVTLTFDDGMQSVFTHALPLLREYQACAHVYVTTGAIGLDRRWPYDAEIRYPMLSWDEVETLQRNNVYIENHTCSHPDMRNLNKEQILEECEKADAVIEKQTGRRPRHFAYPFGFHNNQVRELMRKRYMTSVTTELKPLPVSPDPAALPRLDSYYLRSNLAIKNIDTAIMKGYLALRNILRNIKGSQNRAGYN